MASNCSICRKPTADMRHVKVECFYDVHEVAPNADKRILLREAEMGEGYWGVTRTYGPGVRDRFVSVIGENGPELRNEPEFAPKVRLLEVPVYRVACCNSCRADFLAVFGLWAQGMMQDTVLGSAEATDEATAPVRILGATRFLTEEELRLWLDGKLGNIRP